MKTPQLLDEIEQKFIELELLRAVAKRIRKHGLKCFAPNPQRKPNDFYITPEFQKAWNDLNDLFEN